MKQIGILGAGSWGTALAVIAVRAGNDVVIWARGRDVADSINNKHENSKYLKDISLSEKITAVYDVKDIILCEVLLLTVPAQTLRENCQALKNAGISTKTALVICCKGIEQNTKKLMSEVIADILPDNPVAVLSGPNFAREIAEGLPACATLACEDEKLGMELVEKLGNHIFRTYYSSDIIGAQVSGAVKNVLAIACGIATGKGLGENARASLVTRGMVEIGRLCKAKGGDLQTLMGLSGIGDIMLTCSSRTSRNMSFGYELGQGSSVKNIDENKLAEGVITAQSVSELAHSLGVEMPICSAVNQIIFNGANINNVVNELLQRPLTSE